MENYKNIANVLKEAFETNKRVISLFRLRVPIMYISLALLAINLFTNVGEFVNQVAFYIMMFSLIMVYAKQDNQNLVIGTGVYSLVKLWNVIYFAFICPIKYVNYSELFAFVVWGAICFVAAYNLFIGENKVADEGDPGENSNMLEKEPFKTPIKKSVLIFTPIILFVIGITVAIIVYINSPYMKFERSYKNGNMEMALQTYEDVTDYADRSKMVKKLKDDLSNIVNDFRDEKTSYETNMEKIERLKSFYNIDSERSKAAEKVNKLNESKVAFNNGVLKIEENKIVLAASEFKKVILDDSKNYKMATDKLKELTPKIKDLALNEADSYKQNNNYIEANKVIIDALAVLTDDNDLLNRKKEYEQLAKKQLAEKQKNEQELSVETAKLTSEGTYFISYGIQTIVKNNSQKVVKKYTVGMVAFDANDYPLAIDSNSFVKLGTANAVNMQPGETYGQGQNWSLYNDNEGKIKKVLACVKSVEYYDGSTWENAYYETWKEIYDGKQYKE